ncbi:MAG: threonine synthase [Anaerolineales bacterium]
MGFRSWYECIRGCGCKYSLEEVVYRCEECGGLLDVQHDIEALKEKTAAQWKSIFEARNRSPEHSFVSGVWQYKEWVGPQLRDESIVSFDEGHTSVFDAHQLGEQVGLPKLWVKLSGNSHTGSFKDLGMTVLVSMVKQMIADGKNIKAVACASTGDTSAALAAYAAAADIPAVVLLPRGKVSTEQLIQPIANGALVLSLDTDFDGCMQIVQRISEDPGVYLANSMNSLRIEGQKTVAFEIAQQFHWQVPDWVIIPAGNLGNVSALGKGFLLMKDLGLIDRLPRIACAQAEQANPFYLSFKNGFDHLEPVVAGATIASAIQIGNPVSYERAVRIVKKFDGLVEQASESEIANAAAQADRTGLYACPQTGVALAVLFKLVEMGIIKTKQRVVVISTAHGLKFSRFKVDYHNHQLQSVIEHYANPPVELPADYDLVLQEINNLPPA